MPLPQDGLRAALKPAGWRQGSVLAANDIAAMKQQFVLADANCSWPLEPIAVVVSQTCDILSDKLETEPVVDVVIGELIAEPHPHLLRNQNPRELDVAMTVAARPRHARLYMRKRAALSRASLVGRSPCPNTSLTPAAVEQLVRWMRDRYARTALPDAFDRRVKAKKAHEKIEKVLKKAPEINEVFIALNPLSELPDGANYECALLAAVGDQHAENQEALQKATTAVSEIRGLLSKCDGIEVVEDEAKIEGSITLAELRLFKRFGYEYLSWDNEGHELQAPDHGAA